jgi:hypothetical protein
VVLVLGLWVLIVNVKRLDALVMMNVAVGVVVINGNGKW